MWAVRIFLKWTPTHETTVLCCLQVPHLIDSLRAISYFKMGLLGARTTAHVMDSDSDPAWQIGTAEVGPRSTSRTEQWPTISCFRNQKQKSIRMVQKSQASPRQHYVRSTRGIMAAGGGGPHTSPPQHFLPPILDVGYQSMSNGRKD